MDDNNNQKRDRVVVDNNNDDNKERKRSRRGFSAAPQEAASSLSTLIDNQSKSASQIAYDLSLKYNNNNNNNNSNNKSSSSGNRIYVGSVNDIKESDIRSLFIQFGTITKLDIKANQGYCFIDYSNPEYAKAAMIMDQYEYQGRKIKVGWPNSNNNTTIDNSQALTLHPSLISAKEQAQALLSKALTIVNGEEKVRLETKRILIKNIHRDIDESELKLIFSPFGKVRVCSFTNVDGIGTRGSNLNVKTAIIEYTTVISSEVAAKDMNGFSLAGYNLLVEQTLLKPAPAIIEKKICILENMVSIEECSDATLKDEIAEEAERFGKLQSIDIYVDPITKTVKVRLQYEDSQSATKAFNAMNNRFFAGNRITASLV
jgi:RNA recognition motif-containing protein